MARDLSQPDSGLEPRRTGFASASYRFRLEAATGSASKQERLDDPQSATRLDLKRLVPIRVVDEGEGVAVVEVESHARRVQPNRLRDHMIGQLNKARRLDR